MIEVTSKGNVKIAAAVKGKGWKIRAGELLEVKDQENEKLGSAEFVLVTEREGDKYYFALLGRLSGAAIGVSNVVTADMLDTYKYKFLTETLETAIQRKKSWGVLRIMDEQNEQLFINMQGEKPII